MITPLRYHWFSAGALLTSISPYEKEEELMATGKVIV
jgi:hypothetical protein